MTELEARSERRNKDGASTLDPPKKNARALLEHIDLDQRVEFLAHLSALHSADIADFLEQSSASEREKILRYWGDDLPGEVLSELAHGVRAEILDYLPDRLVSDAIRDLDSDDVIDLVEDMEPQQRSHVLESLEVAVQLAVRNALEFPEDSAGRLMQRELALAPSFWSVGDAIDDIRRDDKLPRQFYELIIVDPVMRPLGKVPLHRLVAAQRDRPLLDLMDTDLVVIKAASSQEEVAYLFNQYHIISAPVVDEGERLVGLITMDDAMEVLGAKADKDIKRLGGVGYENLTDNIFTTTKQRFPWLFVNLLTSILASIVIAQFTEALSAIVALAVLMPIVASMGGNAGTQSLTVAVRALATKDLTPTNARRIILRECAVGSLNGCIFALMIGGVGILWYGNVALGVIIGIAMIGNLIVAGLAGIYVPILLEKLKIDPALASAAFVTTVTDVVGFLAFLGLASAILL